MQTMQEMLDDVMIVLFIFIVFGFVFTLIGVIADSIAAAVDIFAERRAQYRNRPEHDDDEERDRDD